MSLVTVSNDIVWFHCVWLYFFSVSHLSRSVVVSDGALSADHANHVSDIMWSNKTYDDVIVHFRSTLSRFLLSQYLIYNSVTPSVLNRMPALATPSLEHVRVNVWAHSHCVWIPLSSQLLVHTLPSAGSDLNQTKPNSTHSRTQISRTCTKSIRSLWYYRTVYHLLVNQMQSYLDADMKHNLNILW